MTEEFKIDIAGLGETAKTVFTRNGQEYILFVKIGQDDSPDNPIEEEGTANGKILSFNRRHMNFAPDEATEAIKSNPDCVLLSYYEHGLCRWSVQGDTIPGEEFQWDGAKFAGVWVPDKDVLDNIDFPGTDPDPAARRKRLIEYAQGVCETYTQWCNGEVYGYEIELYRVQKDEDQEAIEEWSFYQKHAKAIEDESCWGFYGWEYTEKETAAVALRVAESVKDEPQPTPPASPITVFNDRELNTILHALRKMVDPTNCNYCCDHFDEVDPLNEDEIDELCERLQLAPVQNPDPEMEADNGKDSR